MMTPDERRAKRDEAIKARQTGKPTPTQEENDLKALGVSIDEIPKQPSGAPPDKHEEARRAQWKADEERRRDMRPKSRPGGGYETR
jgi:hypothetical protein